MKSLRDWLETATTWRFASLLFRPPTPATCAQLRALAAEVPAAWRAPALALADGDFAACETEYHRVLGPGGTPACESSYDDNPLAGRGPRLAAVSAFYRAFAYSPHAEIRDVPDHVSVELDFLAYLAVKVAFGLHENAAEASQVAEAAYTRFLDEHVAAWLPRFAERLEDTGSARYAAAAAWVLARAPGAPASRR